MSVQEGVGIESYCSHVHSVEKGNPTGWGLSPTNSRVCLSDLGARRVCVCGINVCTDFPQWGTAHAEIRVNLC